VNAKPSIFAELQRRHVYKVGAAYGVAGWLLVQIVTQVFPIFHVSELAQRLMVLAVVTGFPVALVLAWLFDITPQGIVRTDTEPLSDSPAQARARRTAGRQLNYLLGGLLLLAAGYFAALRLGLVPSPVGAPGSTSLDKSIAVLPFENLSRDPDNAYFAQGVQDEILTRLAKVGALRVISRTSTQEYASNPGNLAAIAEQLGVSNVLEGSVQRIGDLVHINVQLIRARDDDHLWAESYDRKLDNVFGVEGEVAQTVAEALEARLSGDEQTALKALPTRNPAAYDAYLRGLGQEARALRGNDDAMHEGMRNYSEAVKLDPDFALAWAHLSIVQSYMYFNHIDHTSEGLARTREAAETALRLQPELGEAHLADGFYRYRCLLDFDGGLQAFERASKRLPNNAEALAASSYIERRQGKWQQAVDDITRASQLDPRNPVYFLDLAGYDAALRQFPRAYEAYDRALAVSPGDPDLVAQKADAYMSDGQLDQASALLDPLPFSPDSPNVAGAKLQLWFLQRRYDTMIGSLEPVLANRAPEKSHLMPQFWGYLGIAYRWSGRPVESKVAFDKALAAVAALSGDSAAPDRDLESPLALVSVGLGRNDAALMHARRAVEMNLNDSLNLPSAQAVLAQVQAMTGDADGAIAALPHLLQVPNGITVQDLQLDPFWDPLRKDPRFQKLIAEGAVTTQAGAK
jgi:TolB-like protein/Tfp pilus assembly protein PilF